MGRWLCEGDGVARGIAEEANRGEARFAREGEGEGGRGGRGGGEGGAREEEESARVADAGHARRVEAGRTRAAGAPGGPSRGTPEQAPPVRRHASVCEPLPPGRCRASIICARARRRQRHADGAGICHRRYAL